MKRRNTIITKGFKDIIQIKEEAWKKHKVNRAMEPIETLNNVKDILEERCLESDIIKDLILDLNCISTKLENEESVSLYKKAIISIIPEICDAVDEYNHEKIYEIIRNVNGVRPDGHKMMSYQLEKIFCYLNDYNSYQDTEWGLKQAEAFSKEFARKWVNIEPYNMQFDEIKMLTNVACYLEYLEQKEINIQNQN